MEIFVRFQQDGGGWCQGKVVGYTTDAWHRPGAVVLTGNSLVLVLLDELIVESQR